MRPMQAGVVAALALLIVVDNAAAQQSRGTGLAAGSSVRGPVHGSAVVGQPVISRGVLTATPMTYAASIVTTLPAQGQVMPYSYWVSAPNPARIYVEYGAIDQFPFHGRAYGSANDRWSWYYMGGGDSRYLAKYYYPLLR
jgi:hypothetical protein